MTSLGDMASDFHFYLFNLCPNNMRKKIPLLILAFVTVPIFVFAQIGSGKELIWALINLINTILPIAVSLALLFFLWGLAKFIFHAGDEKALEEGKRRMIWGIIALFVMVSVWGIVAFLRSDLFGAGIPVPPPLLDDGSRSA